MVKMMERIKYLCNKVIKRVNGFVRQCDTPLQWVPTKREYEQRADHVILMDFIAVIETRKDNTMSKLGRSAFTFICVL